MNADAVTQKTPNMFEFGTISIGTRFTIDSNGVTFEKTSEREAKIVKGDVRLFGVKSQFGRQKPVSVTGLL